MSRLPLATLPAFLEAARTQNLRAASEALHLTHSAVSQQIRQLEQQLGFELFERRGRSLALNPAGAALQRAVATALETLQAGVSAARHAAEGKTETLRLTVLPSFAQRWLMPRIGRWRERHPDITLEIHASQSLEDLQRERFHAALRVGGGQWRGLKAERLIDSPLIAVASPARAARVPPGDHAALAGEALLGATDQWQRLLALAGVRLQAKAVAEFNDAGLMLQAAEQDLGVALARELLAADALQAGRLVRMSPLQLDDPASATYWFAYPPQHEAWPALQALRDWLHEEMARSRAALGAAHT